MRIITPGHKYELENFEDPGTKGQVLQFIEKRVMVSGPADNNGLVTITDGTTNEEVLAVLIDRMNFLNAKFPCRENSIAITKLDEALLWLNKRTTDRKTRQVEGLAVV